MEYECLWQRLLNDLEEWSSILTIGEGEIGISFAAEGGTSRAVTIVMTEAQWDELVTIPWGQFAAAAKYVKKAALEQPVGHPYLVYESYALVPSRTPFISSQSD